MKSMCSAVDALLSGGVEGGGGGIRPSVCACVCVDVASVPSSVRRRHELFPACSRKLFHEAVCVHDFQDVFFFPELVSLCRSMFLQNSGLSVTCQFSAQRPFTSFTTPKVCAERNDQEPLSPCDVIKGMFLLQD